MNQNRWYLGESTRYSVYLLYRNNTEELKNMPLNLSFVREHLPSYVHGITKPRLVIAPLKYLDEETMRKHGVEYCQLPYGIYKFRA